MTGEQTMFKITQGKGFHMTFANGWTVSVQWGSGNYCPNHRVLPSEWTPSAYGEMQRKLGEAGVPVAEVGWWKGSGEMEVAGYMSPDEVLSLMVELAARKD
jgi:hypothetical protein